MHHHLVPHLMHLGLSEKEACVYLAAIELGEGSVQEIAQKANITRATTYLALESLKLHALIEEKDSQKRRFFVAHTPERLDGFLKKQLHALEEKRQGFQRVLPMLLALFQMEGARPNVRYLEGERALRAGREMFLEQTGDAFQIVPLDEVEKVQPLIQGRDARLEKFSTSGDSLFVLLVTSQKDLQELPVLPGCEVRLLPHASFPIHAEITVRGNALYLCSYAPTLLSVIITSAEMAASARAIFQLAWKGAEPYASKRAG